jgi:tripartite-type tricarboxylate transporter receptor subunit TctC
MSTRGKWRGYSPTGRSMSSRVNGHRCRAACRRSQTWGGLIINSYRTTAIVTLLWAASLGAVQAQGYPTRPVRIVTATPGGGNDYLARMVAPALTTALGQQVIVDNRSSRLVAGIVARATPDGYTLVVGGSTMQFVPLMEKADYNILTDFAPISQLERSPNVLVVNPSL